MKISKTNEYLLGFLEQNALEHMGLQFLVTSHYKKENNVNICSEQFTIRVLIDEGRDQKTFKRLHFFEVRGKSFPFVFS